MGIRQWRIEDGRWAEGTRPWDGDGGEELGNEDMWEWVMGNGEKGGEEEGMGIGIWVWGMGRAVWMWVGNDGAPQINPQSNPPSHQRAPCQNLQKHHKSTGRRRGEGEETRVGEEGERGQREGWKERLVEEERNIK